MVLMGSIYPGIYIYTLIKRINFQYLVLYVLLT